MEQGRIHGKHILLADDEPAVRQALRLVLRRDEHTVSEAKDGREALELFSREPFDLVITDQGMPEMAGKELAANIRRLVPAQRIIMITAYADELSLPENLVDAVLNKPFSFEELTRAMAKVFH
jgi:CheY-like chemotaxis protein